MIINFKSEDAELIFCGDRPRRLPMEIVAAAKRKLDQLDAAVLITDLRNPPGNHLEILKDDRQGQHSIRVNNRFRICFRWVERNPANESGKPSPGDAHDVEIVDYH